MSLDLDEYVIAETDEQLIVEYPTLDVGDDRFDVFDADDPILEPVHFGGERLGTCVAWGTTSSGDRVLLIEKPVDDEPEPSTELLDERPPGLARELRDECRFDRADFADQVRREARWIRHEDELDPFRITFEKRKTAGEIADEIDWILEDPTRVLDGDKPDDRLDALRYGVISGDFSLHDRIERDDRFVGPVDGDDFRQRHSGSLTLDVADFGEAETLRDLLERGGGDGDA